MILNLKALNKHAEYKKFKMDAHSSILFMVSKNVYMVI